MTHQSGSGSLQSLLRPPRARFFDAPPWTPETTSDVVVLGVPSDTGNLGSPRSAGAGVAGLRAASRLFPYRLDKEGCPLGWHDYEQGRPILAGCRIADAGDLIVDRYDPTITLSRLPEVIRTLKRTARLVLILGGDHAMTHWTAGALEEESRLILFDAHEDSTAVTGPYPHAGNVVRFLERQPAIASILQYGLRGLVPGDRLPPADHRVICRDLDALADAVRHSPTSETFLSIDVDVLSPTILRAVAAPSPGGLSPADVLEAAAAIRSAGGTLSFLEIAEFAPAPDEDPLSAMTVAQLVVRLLDVALHPLTPERTTP